MGCTSFNCCKPQLPRIAGNFRGVQFLRFSRLIGKPQKLEMKFSRGIKRGRGHRDLHTAHQFVFHELLLLLRYFKASTTVPSSFIESANAEVKRVIEIEESSDRRKRGHYEKFSPDFR